MNLVERVDVILVEPAEAGNVGACARALKNMGFARFHLVDPRYQDVSEARKMAVHARDVLAATRVHPGLEQAIAGASWVVGVSGRPRTHPDRKPPIAPDALIERLRRLPAAARAALVFGPERTGLTNQQLGRCHDILAVPTAAAYPSMNLSHAVAVVAWELRRASLEGDAAPAGGREPITADDLEGLVGQARRTLEIIGYLDEQNPRLILDDLRKVFARAGLDPRELRMLRGIFHRMDVWIAQHGGPPTPNQQRRAESRGRYG